MDVNKVIFIGRLGQDPTLNTTTGGTSVCNVNLATKYKQGNNEYTTWHRLIFWARLAEIVCQYCKKGSQIYAEGTLDYREWEKDGQKQVSAEITVNQMQMLDTRSSDSNEYRNRK